MCFGGADEVNFSIDLKVFTHILKFVGGSRMWRGVRISNGI